MKPLRAPLAAVMFLTRIPVPSWVGHDRELLARSAGWFPAVGLIAGGWGALVYAATAWGWTPMAAAVISVAATVWLTGAFHEDALADACDGFGGGWERAQVLAIMKDSRVGSYGAVGVSLALLARVVLIAAIGEHGGVGAVARALITSHVLARWSSLPLIWRYEYVREDSSRSRPYASAVNGPRLVAGTAVTVVVVSATVGLAALPLAATAVAVTALGGRYFRRRIGGITGDCLGAANQLVELACYLALAAGNNTLLRQGGIEKMLGALR